MKEPLSRAQRRRERERQELRQAILDAACGIAASEGWHSVTIRKVAEEVEYSPASIYSYFESKEAILQTIVREGFEKLAEELRVASLAKADAEAQLLAISQAYWDFAWRYPELYQVMHSLGGAPFSFPADPGNLPDHWEAFRLSHELLNRWMQEHGLSADDYTVHVEIIWGLLHGLISLAFTQRLQEDSTQAKQLALRAVRDLLWSWQHRSV